MSNFLHGSQPSAADLEQPPRPRGQRPAAGTRSANPQPLPSPSSWATAGNPAGLSLPKDPWHLAVLQVTLLLIFPASENVFPSHNQKTYYLLDNCQFNITEVKVLELCLGLFCAVLPLRCKTVGGRKVPKSRKSKQSASSQSDTWHGALLK